MSEARPHPAARVRIGRRAFLTALALSGAQARAAAPGERVMTVEGWRPASSLGIALAHEHVLVDFIGADRVSRDRYDADEAFRAILPQLRAVRARGCRTLFECTPAYLGRDPLLLERLARASGIRLVTNTGLYGASDDKYVPKLAYQEAAEQLAARWTAEFLNGIEGTGVRPGFIKTAVDASPLSEIDRKLLRAAALCHRSTGLTIACHTGSGAAALETIELLKAEGVSAEAYVWVHAQNEKDRALHLRAAEQGAWLSFDGVGEARVDAYVESVADFIGRGRLRQLLVSQDAGWYRVGEAGGGSFRPYTSLFDAFLPALRRRGIMQGQIETLLTANPAAAFAVRRRTTGSA
jgi:predicted metal-dependent phosphotriesterase family hydrolase